ncbi:MAG: TniB family NTP-binding protein [Sulfuricurvum sp.]|nr:TniB family NTP-binding protein [Sulfuricurvum sp.]
MSELYPHIHPDFQHLMLLDDERRIESLHEPLWINYPKSDHIIQYLGQMLRYPKKPRMQGVLIIGDSNIGKTSIINHFISLHPDSMMEDEFQTTRAYKPVIYAKMQTSEEKDLYISILQNFWSPFRSSDSLTKLRYQTISLMRECNVRMLILDEIQNLLRGTAMKQRIMMDAIKNLSNELMIPIIGAGTQEAVAVLSTEPQLNTRFDTITLPKWDMDKNFRAMIVALEKRLPLKKPSRLDTKEKALLIYKISRGNLGDLHRLLIVSTEYAIRHGIEEITVEVIKKHSWIMREDNRAREIIFDTDTAISTKG